MLQFFVDAIRGIKAIRGGYASVPFSLSVIITAPALKQRVALCGHTRESVRSPVVLGIIGLHTDKPRLSCPRQKELKLMLCEI